MWGGRVCAKIRMKGKGVEGKGEREKGRKGERERET